MFDDFSLLVHDVFERVNLENVSHSRFLDWKWVHIDFDDWRWIPIGEKIMKNELRLWTNNWFRFLTTQNKSWKFAKITKTQDNQSVWNQLFSHYNKTKTILFNRNVFFDIKRWIFEKKTRSFPSKYGSSIGNCRNLRIHSSCVRVLTDFIPIIFVLF